MFYEISLEKLPGCRILGPLDGILRADAKLAAADWAAVSVSKVSRHPGVTQKNPKNVDPSVPSHCHWCLETWLRRCYNYYVYRPLFVEYGLCYHGVALRVHGTAGGLLGGPACLQRHLHCSPQRS